MHISIDPFAFHNAGIGEPQRTARECIALVKSAGFRHLDAVAPEGEPPEAFAAYLQEQGMQVIQSHIPFHRYADPDYDEVAKVILKSIEDAHTIGSKIAVVHGDEFDFKAMTYSRQAVAEFNYRLFYPLVEYAAAHGMRVAFESLFQELDARISPRHCAFVEDLCELVDRYHTDTVGVCWDIGHAKLQYGDRHLDALKTAGRRVICTHMHDNYYDRDLHLFPYLGETDWPAVMRTLREIGYAGDFNLEVCYHHLPRELAPEHLALLYKSVQYLISH